MRQLWRCLASGFVLLASLAFPPALGAESACAREGDRAALVVDTGGSVQTFCVSLPDGETSGLGLIALANEQYGLAYKLGFGGEAVCMLAGVGPTGDDCFEEYPNFWGYWRGDGRGGWVWSGTGAGSTTVGDGDVEGWSWGSGNNGDSHPRPPATTFEDVCAAESEQPPASKKPRPHHDDAAPSDSAGTRARPPGRPAPAPTAVSAGDRPAPQGLDRPHEQAGGSEKEGDRRATGEGSRSKGAVATAQSPSPRPFDEQATSAVDRAEASGPPAAGLAALGAAALLGGAGFVLARRRRSSGP